MINPHPKPQSFPKPVPKRLPERKRMTIALGILGHQCLVVGADTQETYGYEKYPHGKIMSAWRGAPNPLGAICITGAGNAAAIDMAAQEIIKHFQQFTGTMDEFEEWLKKFIHRFYSRHITPLLGRINKDIDYELIIAARHERRSHLWTTTETFISRTEPYAVVGISRAPSSSLLGQLYPESPSLTVTAMLASYVIRQAKLSAEGIGFDTEIRFIFRDGTSIVPDKTVKAWEEIFARYQPLQREIFSYVTGFSPLDIRLPGIVVRKKREFRDTLRDLKKMRAELDKWPAIGGTNDRSTRLVSQTSELEL